MEKDFKGAKSWQRLLYALVIVYVVLLCLMCFLPQNAYPTYKMFSTPGVVKVGRLYFLLTPFNSFVNAGKLDNLGDFLLVLLQNIANVFLLYPLMFLLLLLKPAWRNWQRVLKYSFFISLTIEGTQLLLDALIDAGRVFELDDLWTNSLGGLLAYWTYLSIEKYYQKYQARKHIS